MCQGSVCVLACICVHAFLFLILCLSQFVFSERMYLTEIVCVTCFIFLLSINMYMCVFPYLSSVSYSMCVCSSFIHLCLLRTQERKTVCIWFVCFSLSPLFHSLCVSLFLLSLTINAYMSLYVCGKGVHNKKFEIETYRCHLSCKTNNSLPHYIYSRFPVCHQTFIN